MTSQTALAAALMKALAPALAANGGKTKSKRKGYHQQPKLSDDDKAAYMAQNDKDCIRIFTKAGYKDVQPRVNVLTYGTIKPDGRKTGWLAQNRRVKKGEKSVRVNGFALFHLNQTEEITAVTAESPVANTQAA